MWICCGTMEHHSRINIVDFDFYNVEVFNQCENSNEILMTIAKGRNVHPLLRVIPVGWDYTIPYGLLHARNPSQTVRHFPATLREVI